MATEILLELRNVRKSYGSADAAIEVLHGLNLAVHRGEMVAIMGQSGSGKSTLMNILGTLDKLTSGQYFFAGSEISTFSAKQLASLRGRKIGFVFQSFNLLPRLTVAKNLERPMMYAQIPLSKRQARIDKVLEQVNLSEKKLAFPLKLSGGQQQRVAIARALVMEPELILADEPTGALDSATATHVMKELVMLNHATGTTMVIITHDEKTASYADRVIRLQDGRFI